MSSSHSHVVFGVYCLRRVLTLKERLLEKVRQALCEKIMKPDTSQGTKWTWLQVAQGLKLEAVKLQGPGQNMLKLARQGALSKPRRNWHQGPTCRTWKVPEDTRSSEEAGAELSRNGPRPVGPGRPAQPIHTLGLFIVPLPRAMHQFICHLPPRSREARGTPSRRGRSC
jgi:hypothetical protein